MVKSGSRPTLKRKPPKLPVYLSIHERYEVACYMMNNERRTLAKVAKHFNISIFLVGKIRDEFLTKIWVWKPAVLERLTEAQGELSLESGRVVAPKRE